MGKIKKIKVGDIVSFYFAGIVEKGKIVQIEETGRLSIYDGRYTYPVNPNQIVKGRK